MSDFPTNNSGPVVRIVFLERRTICAECGGVIEPGEPVLALSGSPCRMVHDQRCPCRWTPTVIEGDAREDQLVLPLLTTAPDPRRRNP